MTRKSTIDLVIIGILLEKPRSAYDLNQFIEQGRINRIIKISTPSVYKKCKKLALDGLIDGQFTRDGAMAEKAVYKVNAKGQAYFTELMQHYSVSVSPFYLDFNTVLISINQLPRPEAIATLQALTASLEVFAKGIIAHESKVRETAGFSELSIVKQHRMLAITLVKWAREIVNDYRYNRDGIHPG